MGKPLHRLYPESKLLQYDSFGDSDQFDIGLKEFYFAFSERLKDRSANREEVIRISSI